MDIRQRMVEMQVWLSQNTEARGLAREPRGGREEMLAASMQVVKDQLADGAISARERVALEAARELIRQEQKLLSPGEE